MRDDALCVSSSAELGAAVRYTCDGACLNGQGHLVGDAFFSSYVCDLLRCAGAEVYDSVLRQLHSSAAGDDLLSVHRDRRDSVDRNAELAGQSAVIRHAEALHVLLFGTYDDRVNVDARDSNELRIQRAALNDLLDLNDYLAAGVLAGLSHCSYVQRTDLAMYGAVAVLVAVGSAQEYNVDREALVEQALLAFDVDNLYEVFLGNVVELAAAVARVSKGLQADVGDGADVVSGNITVHMRNDALRQVVSLDLVVQSELAQTGSTVPVTADNALDHAFVTVVVAAGTVAVALTCCEEQGQILRMTGLQKTLLKSLGQGLRACAGYETAGSDGVAVLNLESGLLCGDNAYFLHVDLLLNVNAILAGAGGRKTSCGQCFRRLSGGMRRGRANLVDRALHIVSRCDNNAAVGFDLLIEVGAAGAPADDKQHVVMRALLREGE